jgi:methyl-accepting chemotaxis protein
VTASESRARTARARLSLRWKIAGISGFSLVLVTVVLTLTFVHQMRSELRSELLKRGNEVAIDLSNNLAYLAFSKDKTGLNRAAQAAMRDLDDLGYVVIRGPDGKPLALAVDQDLEKNQDKLPAPQTVEGERVANQQVEVGKVSIVDVTAPIDYRSEATSDDSSLMGLMNVGAPAVHENKPAQVTRVGLVQVGMRLEKVREEIWAITAKALVVSLAVLVICLFAALLLARNLTVPLERLTQAAAGIARGDLKQEIDSSGNDEVAVLAKSFETMAEGLRGMIADLRTAAGEIQNESQAMLNTATQQSALTAQQASAITETSTTVKEIAQTSTQATERADAVIRVAQAADDISREGQQVIEQAIGGMQKLDEQVRAIAVTITDMTDRAVQIGDIIQTVKDLAERSNMLALNASIEASKAGEHGRGFSVVAMEMRNLAEQSKQAAGQVREILGEVQKVTRAAVTATDEGSKRARDAVGLTQSTANTLSRLAQVCQDSSLAGRQIAGNTRQQTLGVDQIVQALRELSEASATTVAGTQEIEEVAGRLKTLAGRLTGLVGRYTV